jgi:3'-phosphoadenosine 5'-phosphosulfate sulfotransferase (PAPS reductase)/FAD synthetase
MNDLIEQSVALIRAQAHGSKKPAAMISFGKDSMVMAALIREALLGLHGLNGQHFPLTHGFPIPVIYHRDPWFPWKHDFADRQIRAWAMEVYDFPPLSAGVKANDKLLELVSRYQLGSSGIDLPKNVMPPEAFPRRDYICGLRDWVARPTAIFEQYPWDLIFLAHKDSDVDPFEGPVPLKSFTAEIGGVKLVFPLKLWMDETLWDYIEHHHIPVQETRYDGRKERDDKWHNNDYIHACTRCIDPRETAKMVPCPKLKRDVPNVGKYVIQFQANPPYIEREKQHARQER